MTRISVCVGLLLVALAPTFSAGGDRDEGDLGLQGWGVRVGVGSGPDQIIGGFHFDLGDIVDRLRFEPNLELGLGDDYTVLGFTAPVHYRWDVDANVEPFAGGGVAVGFVDRDLPAGSTADERKVEIGLKAVGGIEWRLKRGRWFRLQLDLGLGSVHDAQFMAAWTF